MLEQRLELTGIQQRGGCNPSCVARGECSKSAPNRQKGMDETMEIVPGITIESED